jgi:hypothetical protein
MLRGQVIRSGGSTTLDLSQKAEKGTICLLALPLLLYPPTPPHLLSPGDVGLKSFIPLLLRVPSETGRVALLGSMPWPAHYLKEILPELC